MEEREEEAEVADEEDEAEQRDLSAHAPGTSLKGGIEAVRFHSLPPGTRSEPGLPVARLPAPGRVADNAVHGRVADNAVQDNNVHQPEVGEKVEEDAGFAHVLRKRGGGGHSGSSRFAGVTWYASSNKWRAKCKGKRLGYHTTEEAAARACSKYLEAGAYTRPLLSST